ncbi:MAG: YhcH/YjgK/YiaL family protein [Sphingobacteriales bacterium]
MKRLNHYSVLLLFIVFITMANAGFAQQKWTDASAKTWTKSRQWAGDSKIKLNTSTNYLEFARQYESNKTWWVKAFAFLNDPKMDTLKPGKYAIDGDNVYATITDAPSKTFEQSAWESHRNYIDLQYVVHGKEKIGVAPVASATVIKPYDAGRDAANYTADGKFFIASPKEVFLFFPGDAHRPNIKVDGYDTVKKLVIKIRYTTEASQ